MSNFEEEYGGDCVNLLMETCNSKLIFLKPRTCIGIHPDMKVATNCEWREDESIGFSLPDGVDFDFNRGYAMMVLLKRTTN